MEFDCDYYQVLEFDCDDGEDSLEVKTTDLSSYVKVNEMMILIKSWDENTDFANCKHFKGCDWVYIWTLGVMAIVGTNENHDVDNYDGGQDGKMVNIEYDFCKPG